jgi:hypothetical protein
MVMSANGRADIVGSPIELGDFIAERRQIILNGRPYEGWVVTNRRYPRRIQAQLDRYYGRYRRRIAPLNVDPESDDFDEVAFEEAAENADEWYQEFVTEALLALVPGLSESEAELLPLEVASNVLTELGYFDPKRSQRKEANQKSGDDPLSTGATSPEDSGASTPEPTKTSS